MVRWLGHAARKLATTIGQTATVHGLLGCPRPVGHPHYTWTEVAGHQGMRTLGPKLQRDLPGDWATLATQGLGHVSYRQG